MSIKEDMEKLKLVDRLFHSLTLSELEEIIGKDLVVSKLRGIDQTKTGPLEEIYTETIKLTVENRTLTGETVGLRTELISLKTDFQTLIRCLNKGIGDASATSDFYNLKTKHNIYN